MTIDIILGVLAAFAAFFCYQQRKQTKRLQRRIRESFGMVSERLYRAEELDKIAAYFRHKDADAPYIDDITWNDLEMDDIFIQMNHTWSSVGEEKLYDILRTPVTDNETLAERERLIAYFQAEEHREVREKLQESFARMGRTRNVSVSDYIRRLAGLSAEPVWKDYLAVTAIIVTLAGFLAAPAQFVIPFVAVLAANVATYYSAKGRVENYFVCVSYLLSAERYGREVCKADAELLLGYQEKIKEVSRALTPVKRYAFWLRGAGNSTTKAFADMILDYVCMIFHVDLIAFQAILRRVKKLEPQLLELVDTLGFIESMIAVASYRESLHYYAVPELAHDKKLHIKAEDMYHPLITRPVANSIEEDQSVLLTGSNASGKSTFLKTVALCAILAQTVHTVPARSYASCFYQIYTSMALRDNLGGQESYYIVEIKSLKRILDKINDKIPTLCFVDEVLRGTNTVERIAASSQILKNLAERNVLCFAATHDIELTQMLEGRYSNYHFEEEIREEEICFNYLLQKGRATSRNAIRLLGVMGYDETIIEAANQTAAEFTKEGSWKLT